MEEAGGPSTSALTLDAFRLKIPRDAGQEREGQKQQEQEDSDLEACLAEEPATCTDGFFYIPNFITEDEERYLIEKINSAPLPKWKTLAARRLQYWGGSPGFGWSAFTVTDDTPGGQVSSKQTLIPEPMPDFLVKFPPVVRRTKFTGAFKGSQHGEPNHCLVNEYEPGQGIMPHEDGDAYFPAVATISLGSHTLLDIYRYASEDKAESESKGRAREQDPRFSILQERRSLLVTRGAAYKAFLHGIAERRQDTQEHLSKVINADRIKDAELKSALNGPSLERQKRLSLTLRDVERVSKGLAGLLGRRP